MRSSLILISSFAVLFAFACGDDDPPIDGGVSDARQDTNPPQVGADALWQVRCAQRPLAGTTACATQGNPINILEFDGQNEVQVECNVNREDANATVSLLLAQGSHSLAIDGLRVTSDGVVSAGRVRIVDGDNTFVGEVSSSAPSETIPCEISSFVFLDQCAELDMLGCRAEGPAMSFSLLCRNIQHESTPQIRRDMVFPDDAMQGAAVSVFNCPGL